MGLMMMKRLREKDAVGDVGRYYIGVDGKVG